MDLDYVLSWMVGLGSGFNVVASFARFRLRLPGWLAIHGVLLAMVVVGAATGLPGSGYVAAAGWGLFVVLPMSAARRHFDCISRYRLEEALRWAKLAARLHPFDGLPAQAKYFEALLLADRGRKDAARGLVDELKGTREFRELAEMAEYRVDENWGAIVDHVESQPVGTRDLRLAPSYVRALGECGRTEDMLARYLAMPGEVRNSLVLRVQVAGFLGCDHLLTQLREQRLVENSQLEYWLAVAEQARGRSLDAKLRLAELRKDPALESRARTRLESPAAIVDRETWSEASRRSLARFEQLFGSASDSSKPVRPFATWAVLTVFSIVFAFELPGGAQNERNLIELGALLLPHQGDTPDLLWRLVASGFLHFGAVHFGLNALCLWIIGRLVEREYGPWLLLASFFGGSLGAFGLACTYLVKPGMQPTVLVGGSAGVYGLVGALGALSAAGYFVHRSRIFSHRVSVVVVIVVAQLVFDWFTPITSSFLHMTGLALGALVSLPWALRRFRSPKKRPSALAASSTGKVQRR